MNKLPAKQMRFVDEYLIDGNATRSAIAAGYSKKTAQQQGSRLLLNVLISAEINKRQLKIAKKLKLKREDALARQNNIELAFQTLLELALKDKLNSFEEAKYARLMMIVKASDSTRAADFISRHLGWSQEQEDRDFTFNFKVVKREEDEK